MASAGLVAYNPDDPAQAGFLAALAQGETGGAANSASLGTGQTNLSGLATDQYGFPQWTGLGNSHAAGTFQFQPGTWDAIASKFNLNFQNPQDQAEGAWYLAQQTYAQQNNGASLETALNTPSQYGSIQASLKNVWTSVTGNQANPTGLASVLGSYIGNASAGGAAAQGGAGAAQGGAGAAQGGAGAGGLLASLWGGATDYLARGGLLLVGALIVMVAVYALLVQQGYAPSPREIVKTV